MLIDEPETLNPSWGFCRLTAYRRAEGSGSGILCFIPKSIKASLQQASALKPSPKYPETLNETQEGLELRDNRRDPWKGPLILIFRVERFGLSGVGTKPIQ